MACVIVSDRTKELKLTDSFGGKIHVFNLNDNYKYRRRIIMKYVNSDIPSIISHLTASIRNNFSDERKPQLRSFICVSPNISPESLKNSDVFGDRELIFNSFNETQNYEKFPEILSSSAHEENYKTKAYSENILLQMCDLFSFGRDSFEKLTKIQFSRELTFIYYLYDRYDNLVHRVLFENIGMSCPNLQHLDLSQGVFVPNSVFIHLVFQDSEASLLEQNINIWTQEDRYYDGIHYADDVDLFVSPDILYDRMMERRVSNYNVVKISDLLNCVPPPSNYGERKAKLNKLCDSLKVLNIN